MSADVKVHAARLAGESIVGAGSESIVAKRWHRQQLDENHPVGSDAERQCADAVAAWIDYVNSTVKGL